MKNSENFSAREIRQLMQSPAGQALMALLQENHAGAMNAARESAQAGDMQQASRALADFLADPRAKALLQQLQEDSHG